MARAVERGTLACSRDGLGERVDRSDTVDQWRGGHAAGRGRCTPKSSSTGRGRRGGRGGNAPRTNRTRPRESCRRPRRPTADAVKNLRARGRYGRVSLVAGVHLRPEGSEPKSPGLRSFWRLRSGSTPPPRPLRVSLRPAVLARARLSENRAFRLPLTDRTPGSRAQAAGAGRIGVLPARRAGDGLGPKDGLRPLPIPPPGCAQWTSEDAWVTFLKLSGGNSATIIAWAIPSCEGD